MAATPATLSRPTQPQLSPVATEMAVVWLIALFLFHLYFNNRYGYFPDEFDYIACDDHLA